MIQIAGGFQFQDLYVYPAPQAGGTPSNRFLYFPLIPQPETDSQGRPSLLSIPTNQGGFLQLGSHLGPGGPEGEVLAALRDELKARLGQSASPKFPAFGSVSARTAAGTSELAEVSLELAPLQVGAARLQLGKGEADPSSMEDLAQNQSSGFYPFTALFAVQLNTEQQARVMAALDGQAGFLLVKYDASLPLPVQASARVFGDVRAIVTELVAVIRTVRMHAAGTKSSSDPSPDDHDELAEALLDRAIRQGQVKVETQSAEGAPQELRQRAADDAHQRMIDLLVGQARREVQRPPIATSPAQIDLARAETSASFSDSVSYPLSLVADISAWFQGGQTTGTDHIVLPPGS
jgi:hypothetical protein